LEINVRKRSQVQVIQLRGALRMGPAVDNLRQTMDEALSNGDTRMVMNLSEVPMVDFSGIGLLVRYLAVIKQKVGTSSSRNPRNSPCRPCAWWAFSICSRFFITTTLRWSFLFRASPMVDSKTK